MINWLMVGNTLLRVLSVVSLSDPCKSFISGLVELWKHWDYLSQKTAIPTPCLSSDITTAQH